MKPTLHVLTHRQALDPALIRDKVVVVLDILFATTTMVTALDAGASSVVPAPTPEAARALLVAPGGEDALLAGEDHGQSLTGSDHFAPMALREALEPGQTLIYATTNGTPAIIQARDARTLYAAALINAPATAALIAKRHAEDSVLVLCAGSLGAMNLEDFYGAGCLVEHLVRQCEDRQTLTDPALAALGLFRSQSAESCLLQSRVGRMMQARQLTHEVQYSARIGVSDVVAQWRDNRLHPIPIGPISIGLETAGG